MTRLFFYDAGRDECSQVDLSVDAPPDQIRAWLAVHPSASVASAIVEFVRGFTAPTAALGLTGLRIEGIPCHSSDQWFEDFVPSDPDAIGWDPVAGKELARPRP
jgi:hypothetical protein